METINIHADIKVLYITAASFPDGIMAAQQELHARVPFSTERKYYGISRPEGEQGIVYRAAAEELYPGEAENAGMNTLVLKKGRYISLTIHDYMKDLPGIGKAFGELLAQPGLDPQGYCVEWYLSQKEVQCMVRLED